MILVYYTDQVYLHGGLERVLANKLNYFSEHTNIELHVITFQQLEKPSCYEINSKVTFHDLNINYKRNLSFLKLSNIKYAPKHYFKLKEKIRQINPDVIVVCNYEFGFYFMPLIAKKAIKIKEYHSSGHFKYKARKENKSNLKKIIYKVSDYFESKYDYLVLLTKDELKYYKSENTIVIPNAITHINTESTKLLNKKAISAGRIAPVKGFEYLINAWGYVIKTCPDWTLDIYGNGELDYIKKLETQIENLNLQNHVFLKGATQELESKLLKSSIYAMSSLTECFPMVLLEAMSCGVPVVSFDCPNGPRHIIKHNDDGIIVKYLDTVALANSLINLIQNQSKLEELSKQAKNNIYRLYEKNIMPLWLNLFSKKTS